MRNNIKQNFEAVYLRFNTIKRFVHQAPIEILDDKEFKRCINYMTFKYFYANRYLFSINGFEREDIWNIITLFGLTYFGMNVQTRDQRGQYLCMMKFISQRMSNFINWIAKKFGVNEINVTLMGKFPKMIDCLCHPQTVTIDGVPMWGMDSQLSNSEQLRLQRNRLDEINMLMESMREKSTSVRMLSLHNKDYISLLKQKQELSCELVNLKKKSVHRAESKALLRKMRQKLANNPDKYREQLAYYATSKHVASDIRKAARSLCQRYNIDYKSWAKTKMNGGCNHNDFTF